MSSIPEVSRRFSDLTFVEIREQVQQGWRAVIPIAYRGKNGWHAMRVPLPLIDPPSSRSACSQHHWLTASLLSQSHNKAATRQVSRNGRS